MNIKKDVIEAHGQLSDCSVKFLEFVKKNPESLNRSNYGLLKLHEKSKKLQPWPTFISKHTKNEMQEASIKVFQLIKSVPERFFSNDPDKISRYYHVPLEIVNVQIEGTTEEHTDNLLARGDFIFSPAGLKCLEFNISANIGGFQVSFWEPIYLQVPIVAKFLQENKVKIYNKKLLNVFLEHLINGALKKFSNCGDEINISIAFPGNPEAIGTIMTEESYLTEIYDSILNHKYKKIKGEIKFCDYNYLRVLDNQLFLKDKKVHILIELCHGVLPGEIKNVFKAGNLCLYNGPIEGLLSNKLNLALLSEYGDSEMFSEEEKQVIRKYIPWTRKISTDYVIYKSKRVKMENFIILNKEKLVMKPSIGKSGENVFIGRNTDQLKWKEVAKRAFREENWIIQEYIESFPYLYQVGESGSVEHHAVWGFFVFGTSYGGGWVRILPGKNDRGVINSYQGAEESVVFEVEE